MEGQTDGQTDDGQRGLILYNPFCKDGGMIMFFENLRIKFSQIICLNYEPHRKIQYNRKEHNQHNSVFKELKNNDPQQIYAR